MPGITIHTDADLSAAFKRTYGKLSDNLYSAYDETTSRIKNTFGTLNAIESVAPVETTFGGGYGASATGALPEANHSSYINPQYNPKRLYARVKLDNLTIEGSQRTEGAFIKMIDKEVTAKLRNFNRNRGRMIWNDGTAVLGQFSGNASGTAAAPTVTILNTGNYKNRKFHFEPNEMLNVNVDLTTKFTVTSYNESTRVLTLSRYSGTTDLTAIGAGTHSLYTYGSKDAEPLGFHAFHTLATWYGVASQTRWAPIDLGDQSAAPLDTALLTEGVERLETETDQSPTDIKMSPKQYRKYIKILEDQKRFPVPVEYRPRSSKMTSPELIAKVAWGGIQYVGATGNITVSKSKFIRDDMVWFVNFNQTESMHVKQPGWQERDGTVFLRMEDTDAYEARYASFEEFKLNPFHVAFAYNLSIA